jgi:hypothetical protein
MDHLHWRCLLAKPLVTVTRDSHVTVTTVLALATLGGTTQIESFLFFVMLPKVAKASSDVAVAVACHCLSNCDKFYFTFKFEIQM